MKRKYFIIGLSLLALSSCGKIIEDSNEIVTGMKPVYLNTEDYDQISQQSPTAFERVGKIYKTGSYIFVSDKGKGIHVIDNSDPFNPQKITFITIPGNLDMATRSSYLYADNISDLVTINLSDPLNISVEDRIYDVYPETNFFDYPESYNGPFECVDDTKGIVIDWEEATLTNPKCSR